jgi:hypothetical protein
MSMPAFTAEASLYKTSGHYRTGQRTINSSAQTVSPLYPAVRWQPDEVITPHSCAPYWRDLLAESPNRAARRTWGRRHAPWW